MGLFDELRNMSVLLIDDDEWIRDSLSMLFESEGCRLTALETAEDGMEAIKKQTFDILVADYRLPGMDGLTFLRHVRSTQPQIMTALITAYKNGALVSEAEKLGVKIFIEKPFTTQTLETSLTRLLQSREQVCEEGCRPLAKRSF